MLLSKYDRFYLLFLSLIFAGITNGYGQHNSPAALEQMKQTKQWMQTDNAAGLLIDQPINYTEISLTNNILKGDFHRPQSGEKEQHLTYDVSGGLFVGKVYAWGRFNYTRSTIHDANFNASIIDPFRGMPYMVADTNKSEWRNQTYDMSFKVSTPLFHDDLSFGLIGGYKAISAAKQRDIRTENNLYIAKILPSIVYTINDQQHLGANLLYYSQKEESKMGNTNVYVDQNYFSMYGLGTATKGLGNGRTTNYEKSGVGGGLQYHYTGALNLLFSANYEYSVEEVQISFLVPREEGFVKEEVWSGKVQLNRSAGGKSHFLTANYRSGKIIGIESIILYDNTPMQEGYVALHRDIRSRYRRETLGIDYDLTLDEGLSYRWKLGVGVLYEKNQDLYLMPRSVKSNERIAVQARGKRQFFLSNQPLEHRLLLALDGSYSKNLSGGYDYKGSYPDYPVVTIFQQGDSDYLNSSYYSIGAEATYSQKIKEKLNTQLYIKAAFRSTKALSSTFDAQRQLILSVGCNF